MWLKGCVGLGLGFHWNAEEQEIKDTEQKGNQWEGKKVLGTEEGQRDRGSWDEEMRWAKCSQKALVYFSACSRASHAAIVDSDAIEETVETWGCSLESCGIKQPCRAKWNALETKAEVGGGWRGGAYLWENWHRVRPEAMCKLPWCPETWIDKRIKVENRRHVSRLLYYHTGRNF